MSTRQYDYIGPKSYNYTYDAENQLTAMATDSYYTPTNARWKTEFTYDGRGRLRKRIEYTWLDPYGWYGGVETRYVYDGMRVIQERDSSNTPTVGYTRGSDLSGSPEGAGGIGGLLARSDGYSSGSWTTNNYYHADGNGNITYMVNSSQSMVATYRYDPFGNYVSQSGSLAGANVYRFSSKEIHVKSGMYYYGYRLYDPNLQRWLNREPLAGMPLTLASRQTGRAFRTRQIVGEVLLGSNLYGFARNNSVNFIDSNGLYILDDDGFPIMPTGTALDSYFYDKDTKQQHDRIMCEGWKKLRRGARDVALAAAILLAPEIEFGGGAAGYLMAEGEMISGFVLSNGEIVFEAGELGHAAIAEMYGLLASTIPPLTLKEGVTAAFTVVKEAGEIGVFNSGLFQTALEPVMGIITRFFY